MEDFLDVLQVNSPTDVNTNEQMTISVIVVFITVADQVSFATSANYEIYAGGGGLL